MISPDYVADRVINAVPWYLTAGIERKKQILESLQQNKYLMTDYEEKVKIKLKIFSYHLGNNIFVVILNLLCIMLFSP